MGSEWGQFLEWKYAEGLEWRDLQDDMNAKMQHFTKVLNQLYHDERSLWELDDENTTIEQKKQLFEELQKRTVITACDYCNGYYGTTDVSKRYPAGEQMD